MTKPTTQKEKVLKHLKRQELTTWGAIKLYGITRLAVYIRLLRGEGFKITAKLGTHVINGRKYHHSIYKLIKSV